MAAKSNYLENKIIDYIFRGGTFTAPTGLYVALINATAGQSPRSTAVTSGQTTIPASPNGRMYRVTTAGTTGSGEPTWGTVAGGTTTDGTAVWTEMSNDLDANTNLTEVSGNSYARTNLAPSATNWSSTGGATTTTNPSAGTTGTTSNNAAITFPTPSGSWGLVVAIAIYDAITTGNLLYAGLASAPLSVTGSATPYSFPISSLSIQEDN